MPNTTIIIPTYNESENIPELARLIRYHVNGACEVLIMDDSPDKQTIWQAEEQGWKYVWRTHNGSKKGLSPAVMEGIQRAKRDGKEAVIVMDADLQHPPKSITSILLALEKHDFVMASRYIAGGGIKGKWSLKRRIVSRVANLMAMPLKGFKVKDMMSGFFGFRLSGINDLDSIKPKGYKVGLELLVRGNWNNIVEIPYTFGVREKGESKLSGSIIGQYIKQLVGLYLYKFRWVKFILVGLSGVAVNLGLLWALTEGLGFWYMGSATIASVVSITNNYAWNYLWTFRDKYTGVISGWTKYVVMASVASLVYLGLVAFCVEVLGMWYLLSAVLSIIITFIGRYLIASRYIWKEQKTTY